MKKIGLKSKILIVITLLLLIAFGLVTISTYRDATKVISKQIDNQLVTKTDYLKEKMQRFFENREIILESDALYITSIIQSPEQKTVLQSYLTSQ